ncbi:MAG: diaminopimelate epimerase [Deltaproteobacteria bacterium]|nr:diaminopimelate epimerase [Deltaproteobacteria bacterium]MBI4373749.1 diaminopimelate epimerase [Deltaproteobacteria bacterium]
MNFVKMHGLGNDFIFINGIRVRFPNPGKNSRFLCDRRKGIGADQLLIVGKSKKADFMMEIYNADGSRVEMCGNGIRCLGKYVIDEKLTSKKELTVETLAGIQKIKALSKDRYTVDMGEPILKGNEIPVKLKGRVINRPIRLEGREYRVTCVSMGNPHCVLFVDELKKQPVTELGPLLEHFYLFPKGTNVEFVNVLSSRQIEMRTWERGAGETLACGSGACAAVVAGRLNHLTENNVSVKLMGGSLDIEWSRSDNHIYMTGPAATVYKGEVEI